MRLKSLDLSKQDKDKPSTTDSSTGNTPTKKDWLKEGNYYKDYEQFEEEYK